MKETRPARIMVEFRSGYDPTEVRDQLERGELTALMECFLKDLECLLKKANKPRLIVAGILEGEIGLGYNKLGVLLDGSD